MGQITGPKGCVTDYELQRNTKVKQNWMLELRGSFGDQKGLFDTLLMRLLRHTIEKVFI